MKHVISCYPSGNIEAVQNDNLPLHSLGKSTMTRASTVEWDGELQLWVATIHPEFRKKNKKSHEWVSKSREKCIEWELEYLNKR